MAQKRGTATGAEVDDFPTDKVYRYTGQIGKMTFAKGGLKVKIEFQKRPDNFFLAIPLTFQPLSAARELSEGDWATMQFQQHGFQTLGVHKVLEIHKATDEEVSASKQEEKS
jgi:hypothetical protein